MMKSIFTVLVAVLMSVSAHASQIVAYTPADGNVHITLKDDPTHTGPYEAAEMFDSFGVSPVQFPFRGAFKIVSDNNFSLSCTVPAVMQPSGERFSDCVVLIKPSEHTVVSERNHSAEYRVDGESAAQLFKKFIPNASGKFHWQSQDNQLVLDSSEEQFSFRLVGR